jgi:hypothetical protein
MSRIDRARFVHVIGLLTAQVRDARSERGAPNKGQAVRGTAPEVRNVDALRSRLRARLGRLRRESPDFRALAPEVTVREILTWEFGETIVSHRDFNRVASEIAIAIQPDGVGRQLNRLIAELSAAE